MLFLNSTHFAHSHESLQSKTWTLPYYSRHLNNVRPYAILCLLVREEVKRIEIGHAALSLFVLDQSELDQNRYVSTKVHSAGYWPYREAETSALNSVLSNLRFNSPKDHFLTFLESRRNRDHASHCVPITEDEALSLQDLLMKYRNIRWKLNYNCNDISRDAFHLATGIYFQSRSPLTLFFSTPQTLCHSVKEYQKSKKPRGTFTYTTKNTEGEIKVLDYLAKHYDLLSSPFKQQK